MAVRTAYAPVAGSVLTAANVAKLPGGWIGYIETTSTQSGIGTGGADLTTLTLSVTVGTSRRLRISAYVPVTNAGATAQVEVDIFEGAALQRSYAIINAAAGILAPSVVITPSSGAHTYKLFGVTSTGTFSVTPSATNPAYLLVEDIGTAT